MTTSTHHLRLMLHVSLEEHDKLYKFKDLRRRFICLIANVMKVSLDSMQNSQERKAIFFFTKIKNKP